MRLKISTIVSCTSLVAFSLTSIQCKKDDINPIPEKVDFKDYKFEEPAVTGNTYYIDPENGSADGDGSFAKPWRTLQEVLENNLIEYYKNSESYKPESELVLVNKGAPIKGGDKIVLRNGYHGIFSVNTFIFKSWLTIEADGGHQPTFTQIRFYGAFKNVYLKNLTVLKDSYPGSENYWEAEELNRNNGSCVILQSNNFWGKGSHIKLKGLTIKTTQDVSAWLAEDWVKKSASGISLRSAEFIEVIDCIIENVRHGILIEYFSNNSSVINNSIKNYSADGSRIISNNVLFAYNTITNCYDVDDNHDDAIQSYSRGEDNSAGSGTLKNVVIRGNLIIGNKDSENPLAGYPQGIGCFDGMFDNWTIENNVVITDHYHGISFYGLTNSKIVNNTVIDQNYENKTCPWIKVTAHKNGNASKNCIVANNIVSSSISADGSDIKEATNYIIGKDNYSSLHQLFIDPVNYDFHLLVNDLTKSEIIDQGEYYPELVSSEMDKDNKERLGKPDLGAYEMK